MSDRSICRFARNDMCLMSTEVSFAASDSASASFDALLARLSHSRFRSRFHLGAVDIELIGRKSLSVVREHAVRFLLERLAPANPVNDGRQTPWRGHPVFRAQHACACCCRGCLFKWQQIPPDRPLSAEEVERLADLLMAWISRELVRAGRDPQTYQAPHAAESGFPSSSNKTRGRKRAEAPGSRSAKASFAEPSLFDEV